MTKVLDVQDLEIIRAASGAGIVSDAAFSLREGEILGLVGESGSGKTTLGLAILNHCRSGLKIMPASRVVIGGASILDAEGRRLQALRRTHVSYVPQDPGTALNPALRIRTQLAECGADGGRPSIERLLQLLQDVNLPATEEFLNRFPHQMSGGQQQRVAIALAFSMGPKVVVMDEPTTGLDVSTQSQILALIRRVCALKGAAVIYISHDLAVVAQLASQVAVMYSGRIVEQGPASRILTAPSHPYTRALIRAVPGLGRGAALLGIGGESPDPDARPMGCAFAPRCSHQTSLCEREVPANRVLDEGHMIRCHAPVFGRLAGNTPASGPVAARGGVLLDVQSLSANHGGKRVLHDISFSIRRGACLAVVGQSGSGKTTLARSIAGLHDRFAGSLTLDGLPVSGPAGHRSAASRKDIQYVFQNPYASLNPRRTIGESLTATLLTLEPAAAGEAAKRVQDALKAVSLSASTAARYPRHLSGGQRQRAAIARALIVRPKLLICDEVTSALDVSVQAVVLSLIDRLKRELGLSVMFVTHNLALIQTIAEEVIVLSEGRIVEHGSAEEVITRPKSAYAQGLLADTPAFALHSLPDESTDAGWGLEDLTLK